jgi:hypothetical protein
MNRDEQGKPVLYRFQWLYAGGSFMCFCLHQRTVGAKNADLNILTFHLTPQGSRSDSAGDVQGKADYNKIILSGYLVNYNVYECSDKKWIALGALN